MENSAMKHKNQRGAAAVEFALVLPLLLAIFAGMVEMGVLIYNQQVLTNASREGARAGIVQDPTINVDTIVQNYCDKHLFDLKSGNTRTPTVSTTSRGNFQADYTVSVEYDYEFLLPQFFGFDVDKRLVASTTMKMEDVPASP